jgi:hypothetical protein
MISRRLDKEVLRAGVSVCASYVCTLVLIRMCTPTAICEQQLNGQRRCNKEEDGVEIRLLSTEEN